jgi:hypothetical protein
MIIGVWVAPFLAACKKHKNQPHNVNVVVHSPLLGSTVTNPFLLHVDFSSEKEIHDIAVLIKKLTSAGDSIAYQFANHIHATQFTLKDTLIIPVSQLSDMRLQIKTGEPGNESVVEGSFFLSP